VFGHIAWQCYWTLQRALGHRQITTTEVYARVDDDAVRRAMGG
jgi:site-specific recombinase XerD